MTSELFTPLTEVEVPDENEASVSAKFNVVMRRRKAGAAKPARGPGAPTTAELPKHAVSHWPYRSWCSHCGTGTARSRQHRTDKGPARSIPVLSADYCFIGGELAVHESP